VEPNQPYRGSMTSTAGRRKRQRGEIHALPSGSLRVRVYAGIDPITGKKHFLSEVVPAGPKAEKEGVRANATIDFGSAGTVRLMLIAGVPLQRIDKSQESEAEDEPPF
jgi:hypothetical protein